jgi:hypothetical protein
MMRFVFIVLLGVSLISCGKHQIPQDIGANTELLKLILSSPNEDGRYTIVSPVTDVGYINIRDRKEIKRLRKRLSAQIRIPDYDLTPLVNMFISVNRDSVVLKFESDLEAGYLIDKDGKFEKYFKDGGGGWEKLYKENPKASGMTSVSIPAYDKENGIILVYKGTQHHWLAGAGHIVIYRFKEGNLREIGSVMVWIS